MELNEQIEEFNQQSFHLLNLPADIESLQPMVDDEHKDLGEEEDVVEEAEEDMPDMQNQVLTLLLPSNVSTQNTITKEAKLMEIDLRKGQVNDALEGLRESLGYKSILFATEVSNLIN